MEVPPELPALRLLPEQPAKRLERFRPFARRAVAWSVWLYLALVLGVWLLLYAGGDRWWFATVLLFGPRWLLCVPMLALVPLAAWLRRRMLWALLGAGVVLWAPILGFCVPWGRHSAGDAPTLRVLTCNAHGVALNLHALAALIQQTKPDVVALQECPAEVEGEWMAGWNVRRAGQLFVASRFPLSDVVVLQCRHPPGPWPPVHALYCKIRTPCGPVGFCNVHLATPRQGLDEVLDRWTVVGPSRSAGLVAGIENRGLESAELTEWLQSRDEPLIVVGDFNMPTDSAIYRRYWAGFHNAFSSCGLGFGYTKWTDVGKLRYGARIDHILTDGSWRCSSCWVERDVGSDHVPMMAELTRK